jgi:hypothetical protein
MKKLLLLTLINLTINSFSQNNPPIAVNDTFYVNFNDTLNYYIFSNNLATGTNFGGLNFLDNDTDPDVEQIIIDTAFYYGLGSFTINTYLVTGSFYKSDIIYSPPFNYVGIDSIQYVIKDVGTPVMYDTAWVYFKVKHQEFEFLDLNNIKARLGLYGLFQDMTNSIASFESPKGSGNNTIYAANLWLAGKNQDSVYANCETFGAHFNLNPQPYPYYVSRSGPIMDSIYYPKGYDYQWDRLWKITNLDIIYHQNNWNTSGYQAIEVIKNWPAHGDTSKGQAFYLAPFVDNNNDGIYNPYDGDFPKIKGQQAIYNIYNDVRATPGSASTMNTEIHYMAYAYNCPSDSAINNTIFVDYTIYNRSNLTYDSSYVGFWADFDIGGSTDDYVGCDVARSTFYGYNGDNNDEGGNGIIGYGIHPPAQGVTFLQGTKQDNDGIDNPLTNIVQDAIDSNGMVYPSLGNGFSDGINDNEHLGMEHFVYYSIGGGQHLGDGDPQNKKDNYNYLKGFWRDNTQFVWGGNGHISSGGTIPAKYLFPESSDPLFYGTYGVPPSPANWSELSSGDSPGDRRGLGSTGPFTFDPDSSIEITLALVFGRDYQNTGAQAGVVVMQERIDSIRSYYLTDFVSACGGALSIIEDKESDNSLLVYPNPFNQQITINYELQNSQAQLKVFNSFGKLIKNVVLKNNQTVIDLSQYANGIYFIHLLDGKSAYTKKVVKQ